MGVKEIFVPRWDLALEVGVTFCRWGSTLLIDMFYKCYVIPFHKLLYFDYFTNDFFFILGLEYVQDVFSGPL